MTRHIVFCILAGLILLAAIAGLGFFAYQAGDCPPPGRSSRRDDHRRKCPRLGDDHAGDFTAGRIEKRKLPRAIPEVLLLSEEGGHKVRPYEFTNARSYRLWYLQLPRQVL